MFEYGSSRTHYVLSLVMALIFMVVIVTSFDFEFCGCQNLVGGKPCWPEAGTISKQRYNIIMMTTKKLLLILPTLPIISSPSSLHFVNAFSSFTSQVSSSSPKAHADVPTGSYFDSSPDDKEVINADCRSTSAWATYALLFSSLSDGILPNDYARSFLRYSLVNSMLREHIVHEESLLESSVMFSPCNGPNTETLNNVEHCDMLLERGKKLFPPDFTTASYDKDSIDSWSEEAVWQLLSDARHELQLRVLYIPTAMYALNPQSTNTPGKQRQRARADGKQRRDQLLNVLTEMLSFKFNSDVQQQIHLLAVTLDLDDGSLKQPYGPENKSLFPENDVASLTTWQPHLIYVEGGNTFWLQHCIDEGGYASLIKGACTGNGSAVYCGKSAGAIVAGKRVDVATWKEWDDPAIVPDKKSYSDWLHCLGMEFVGEHSFFPHMSDTWSETVREKMMHHNLVGSNSVYCLREHDACCVMGEKKLAFVTAGLEATSCS